MTGLLVGTAARATPIVAGAIAVPQIAMLMVVGTACLGALMLVRHLTDSEAKVTFNKTEGFGVDLKRAS
jgi:hypothetical protein